jgi:ABC-type amino acid transport system permease subunit
VTLPIGGRIALPSTINTAISVLKNTSLLLLIGYPELTYVANSIQSNTFRVFETFTALALCYLAIVWVLSALIRFLEGRLALPEAL